MGRVAPTLPRSPRGYALSGITDVAAQIPIGRLIDRGSSPGDYLVPQRDPMFDNYRAFVATRQAGHAVERAIVGSDSQIVDRAGAAGELGANVRIVAANDQVWTGHGDEVETRFPPLESIAVAEDRPTENMCSVALRISYGAFSYFTGGDMPGYPCREGRRGTTSRPTSRVPSGRPMCTSSTTTDRSRSRTRSFCPCSVRA